VTAQSVVWTDDTPSRTLAPGTGKTGLSRFTQEKYGGRRNRYEDTIGTPFADMPVVQPQIALRPAACWLFSVEDAR